MQLPAVVSRDKVGVGCNVEVAPKRAAGIKGLPR